MANKKQVDRAKAKAQRDKKIAIAGGVLLAILLVIEVPKTMKMLNGSTPQATPPPAATTTTPATAAVTTPGSIAAPTLAGSPTTAASTAATASSDLVSAVPVSADTGQLQTFERFATKDPFVIQATAGPSSGGKASSPGGTSKSGSGSSGSSGSGTTPKAPPVPPTPPPTSAVISVNGELMSVSTGSDFPTSGTVYTRAGSLFHLVSLTQTTAKVAIAGGSYASGAAALTLKVGTPVTLQNTADGSKYTLLLEPQGTPVPTSTSTTSTTTAPTTTTTTAPTLPVVPSGGGG